MIHGSSRCPAFDTVIVTHIFFFPLKKTIGQLSCGHAAFSSPPHREKVDLCIV